MMSACSDLAAVLEAVARTSGIPAEKILRRYRGQEFLDARWLAVQLLCDLGYYSRQVAAMTGMTARNVNMILTGIRRKQNNTWRLFGKNLEECRKLLGIHKEIS